MPRTIVITGASSGVGLAAAKQFAQLGDHVVVVGRNPQRLTDAVAQVRAAGGGREPDQFRADFERLDDVRALAAHLRDGYPTIDVLASNAGGMVRGYHRTADGFEATIQSNYLAPFLLVNLLRERLTGGRVINTASAAHRSGNLNPDDLAGSPRGHSSWRSYSAGKAAVILFAAEAARRWPDILSVSFHPGIVRTNFGTGAVTRLFFRLAPFLVTPENAGALLVWLASTPAADLTNGGYFVGHQLTEPGRAARDPAIAARLWDASAEAVGLEKP